MTTLVIKFPPGTPEWVEWMTLGITVSVFLWIVWLFCFRT